MPMSDGPGKNLPSAQVDHVDMQKHIQKLEAKIADITSKRSRESEYVRYLEARLRQMEATLELVPVGVVLADDKGHIFHGNTHVETMLRHPVMMSSDINSYQEWVAFHSDGRRLENHEYPLARIIRDDEEEAQQDCLYQRGDGTTFWMRIIGRPVRDKKGKKLGASVALIDIDREVREAETQKVLIGELNHRVKNAFAVVKAIVSQSLRKARIDKDVRETIEARVEAYGASHAKLVGSTWIETTVDSIARDIVTGFAGERARFAGERVELSARRALALSMAFYELSTNALKYGALSVPQGCVDIHWTVEKSDKGKDIVIVWNESGGPHVKMPKDKGKGFGSFIIDRAICAETGGKVALDYKPDGLMWTLRMPQEA